MVDIGINFRASAGFVTDGTNETYCRGQSDLYPITRAMFTFGWNNFVDMERDITSTGDRRLAGVCKYTNNAGVQTWRLDLPVAGTYDISMALGREYFTTVNYVTLQDNVTNLFTISALSVSSGNYGDANGTIHTTANWPTTHTKRRVTFASTTARLLLSQGGADTNDSAIDHIRFEEVATGTNYSKIGRAGVFAGQFSGQK